MLCIFVTVRYKQINSDANMEGQSISLNFWFQHMHDHKPNCKPLSDAQSTLEKYVFSDIAEEEELMSQSGHNNAEEDNEKESDVGPENHLYAIYITFYIFNIIFLPL